jgi:4-amino-4-deoxy-L-arabinose transferase-like glycosyltransferase
VHSRFYLPFLVILWAALYLPGLGGMEIKGEEGRRILPAVAMLEEGHWITPSVAGETYLRKPPLINWAIAGSFALFDVRNEWAARLPSALCMLVLAAALYLGVRAALGAEAALLAALFALTNISSFEKGRLAEIEAMYVAFTGAAFAAWLGGCWTRKALWTGWLTAGFFLGLGMLTKGPAHLIFFYAAVAVPLLWNKRWKELFHPAHGAALVVTAALFLAWAIPHWNETRNLDVGGVWGEQLTGRILPSGFEFGQWLINFPRAILNFSPWILFAAALSHRRIRSHVPTEILSLAVPLAWGAVGSFFLVMALPGSIPRYTLPYAFLPP